jgi:hypothetical protein
MSHASVDNDAILGRKVKNEPTTPAAHSDLASSTMGDTPMPAPTVTTRRAAQTSNRNKRKRSIREVSEVSEGQAPSERMSIPPPDRSVVVAVRNFPRLCNTVMQDITSHKHASLFSMPVRDRDAEGYSDMILRPTDLKTIKAAITAGARAVNAAVEAGSTPAAATSVPTSSRDRDASAIILPWSEDLVPPKGIVNSAQLERELYRMFANAVMFNPGEEDVVADAKEMAASVEVSFGNFKSAEKGVESAARKKLEDEEDVVMEEETASVTTKRRR